MKNLRISRAQLGAGAPVAVALTGLLVRFAEHSSHGVAGIAGDIATGLLLYALARRFTAVPTALGAMALYLFNPAIVVDSSVWSDADSVACFFALLAVYALVRTDDGATRPRAVLWTVGGWVSFACSVAVEPFALVLVPLFIAFANGTGKHRTERRWATLVGAIALAATVVAIFPHLRSEIGAYPFNSVNAFNLWALHVWSSSGLFWQPDLQRIGPLTQADWGIVLVLVAVGLIVWRYLQAKTAQAFVEGCTLSLLALFVLGTRMHERFLFDAVAFTIACLPFARRYFWCACGLSIIFWSNLVYASQYLALMTSHSPTAINPTNLWGPFSALLALCAVCIFFYLGFVYLGSADDAAQKPTVDFLGPVRDWCDPQQGLSAFRRPFDDAVMWALGVGSFLLSLGVPTWYWKPAGEECWTASGAANAVRCGIFDETYFARAAEEYLRNLRIYENTHPPLTKLLVTASTWMFGGLNGGDHPWGWRFLDVVFGALSVMLLYAFAKRVTASTAWAAVAALFLVADGMHYVQSRIATPESFVLVFSLAATYAFYRFWIALQTDDREQPAIPLRIRAGIIVASAACGIGAMLAFDAAQHWLLGWPWFETWATAGQTSGPGAVFACAAYFACAFYLLFLRLVAHARIGGREPTTWLLVFAFSLGALVSSKWYGVMGFGVSFLVLILLSLQPSLRPGKPALWGNPRGVRLGGALVAITFVAMTVYGAAWLPDLIRQAPDVNEIHTVNDVVDRQYAMFDYHDHALRGVTHPYASKWFEWPFDYVPVAYYYRDARSADAARLDAGRACCLTEITSMPNPVTLWIGLLCVPLVGVLGWRERNKGYALLVLTYLLQWLPWAKSPRLAWEYHFFVDIPLICLCNAIVLQRLWQWAAVQDAVRRNAVRGAVVCVACAVVAAFVFFLPVLSAWPLNGAAWQARMWFPTWVRGPG